jgi:dATP pyrophosphohydrolase
VSSVRGLQPKIPISTLVVVYTPELDVLVMERADAPGYWQSVTGSQEPGETLAATATRELREETGIDAERYGGVTDWNIKNVYDIFPRWRHRYAPGTTSNTEHVFGLAVPQPIDIALDPREHLRFAWLPWKEAAEKCFSWSNRAAIERLGHAAPPAATLP